MGKLITKVTTIDSRDVAEMMEKRHDHLMRDIRGYIEHLGHPNFGESDFFIKSTYINSQNKEQPCYLVTRKGCELIAHKLIGQKGTLFTAAYINRFHELEAAGINRIPQSYAQALRLAADQQEEIERLETSNETLKIALNESLQFFTVAKYNNTHKMGWDLEQCKKIGKCLTAYCRTNSIEIQKCETNDERFGETNSYPLTAWDDFMQWQYVWLLL